MTSVRNFIAGFNGRTWKFVQVASVITLAPILFLQILIISGWKS